MKNLEDVLRPTQKELFNRLGRMFKSSGAIISDENYILVPGEAPIMLVAHLDTVHKERVRQICKTGNGNILMSPQGIGGDDRCGVYALLTSRLRAVKKPWLLFTCNEEVGGVGASKFCKHYRDGKLPKELADLKLLVEIDRKGRNDAVYYECDNPELERYITSKGFQTAWGTFSDISYVAPALGVAAVNLSSGYYNAHTQHEYINRKHLNATVKKVDGIVADAAAPDFPQYVYMEADLGFGRGSHMADVYHAWGYDIGWGDWPSRSKSAGKKKSSPAKAAEEEYQDPDLIGVPEEIQHEFRELIDFGYSPDELREYLLDYGPWAIRQLYDDEIGQLYADLPDPDLLGDEPDVKEGRPV